MPATQICIEGANPPRCLIRALRPSQLVVYDRFGYVPNPPPALSQAAAQIHVFHVQEDRLIEAGD
jgi:hypothetical protein